MANYQTQVSSELDRLIMARALKLHAQGELKDEDGRLVEVRIDSDGRRHIPKYTITKIALEKFANGKAAGEN